MMIYNKNKLYTLMVDVVNELYKQNMAVMMIYEKKTMEKVKALMKMKWRPSHILWMNKKI